MPLMTRVWHNDEAGMWDLLADGAGGRKIRAVFHTARNRRWNRDISKLWLEING